MSPHTIAETFDLSDVEREILLALVESKEPVDKGTISAQLGWHTVNALEVNVHRLRRKIAPLADQGVMIQTVRGFGYQLLDPLCILRARPASLVKQVAELEERNAELAHKVATLETELQLKKVAA